jgi:hypothetical protein
VVAEKHQADDGLVRIPQTAREGEWFDNSDRISIGVALLNDLLAMQVE